MTGDQAEATRSVIRVAIREFPQFYGKPGWTYGLDDLDFEDFIPRLAWYVQDYLAQAS